MLLRGKKAKFSKPLCKMHCTGLFGSFVSTLLVLVLGLTSAPAWAGPGAAGIDDLVMVKIESAATLRGLAEKFLNDPDLWPVILSINGIADIADLQAGQQLSIPASQVKVAASALASSLVEIQRANEAGAQLFAPILIKHAIDFRDQAMVENRNGTYPQAISLASESIKSAGAARSTSEERRDIEAEARLSDRQGWVEGQKTSENAWSERDLNAVLNEQEKLRTLSDSTAQVVFRDASRLRLNPNSQAVIQRMRDDPLKRRKEAQISLVEGDFYALLAPDSDRSRLEVKLTDVDAQIDSGSFWVSQEKGAAKFSNYDAKPVAILSDGKTVTLGRNEGVVVRQGEAAQEKVTVIGRVELSAPADNETVFGKTVTLRWNEVAAQQGYWLEVAFDARFDRMVDSISDIPQNRADKLSLAPGIYYWRVAALDALGLPGPMSAVRRFEIINDDTPPFLRLRTPDHNAVLREAAVTISGDAEAGVAVQIGDEVAAVDKDGRFFLTLTAKEGANTVDVVARDVAGNETRRQVAFTYLKDEQRQIAFDTGAVRDATGRFLTAGRQLSLAGSTTQGALLSILDAKGALRSETYADQSGHFAVTIPLVQDAETFDLRVTTTSGFAYREAIEVVVADRPPQFRLLEPLPQITAQPRIGIAIAFDPLTKLLVNGAEGDVRDGVSHFDLGLAPGSNLIEIVATDAVGLVTIEKHTVLFDDEKPVVTDKDIVAKTVEGRNLLSIRIGAADASGLAQTSRFRVRLGDVEKTGVLRYNRATRSYFGSTETPDAGAGTTAEIVVELADIAGNINEVKLQ